MRTALSLAVFALAGSAIAQMPIPPYGATMTSTLTGGFWFQAPVDFVIVGLAVPNEAAQSHQVVEVIDLGPAPPPAWPGWVVGTQLFYNNSTVAASVIPCAIPIMAGSYIGILGACTPGIGSSVSFNSYSGALGVFASDILGFPTTITRLGAQAGIGAGGNQPCWQEAAYNLSRVEVYVAPAGNGMATIASLGAGCVATYDSFYQGVANATLASSALSGNVLFLAPHASGYQGAWFPGMASAFYVTPVVPTPLAVFDDGEVTLTPTTPLSTPYGPQPALRVSGNGIIGFGAGPLNFPGTDTHTPTPGGFLNATFGGIYAWHDYDSSEVGSGAVQSEEIAGTLYITFNDVENHANPETANRSTMQFQLDLASGTVRIVWLVVDGNASSVRGSAHVVGVTAPAASADPGSITFATASAAQLFTTSPETLPLTLAASTRPVINTSWSLTTSNIPVTGVIGVDVFGLSDPGINDLFLIGMPTCGLRAALDYLVAWPVVGNTHAHSLALPNNPSLVSIHLYTTSAVFQVPPVNAFGAITSNGIDGRIGDL